MNFRKTLEIANKDYINAWELLAAAETESAMIYCNANEDIFEEVAEIVYELQYEVQWTLSGYHIAIAIIRNIKDIRSKKLDGNQIIKIARKIAYEEP